VAVIQDAGLELLDTTYLHLFCFFRFSVRLAKYKEDINNVAVLRVDLYV
jgi:hypothetical protein